MEDITEFISTLEKDISQMKDDTARLEAKLRMEQAMKVYRGEDELISSLEILERIKTQPEEEKFLTNWITAFWLQ